MLTMDQIKQRSYKRICEQGALGQNKYGTCLYYQCESGNKCSVGVLLTDEDARLVQDELGMASITNYEHNADHPEKVKHIFHRNGIDLEDDDILSAVSFLQATHDNSADFDHWKTLIERRLMGAIDLQETSDGM